MLLCGFGLLWCTTASPDTRYRCGDTKRKEKRWAATVTLFLRHYCALGQRQREKPFRLRLPQSVLDDPRHGSAGTRWAGGILATVHIRASSSVSEPYALFPIP